MIFQINAITTFLVLAVALTGHNTVAVNNSECRGDNLGYGFSESMHDPSLGDTHYGQADGEMCYPKVHSLGSGVSGKDDSVAVLVGGNFNGQKGAEIEGNMVVLGDFRVEQNGPLNFASAGEGTQITPHKGGECIKVGGDMSSAKRLEVFYPHYQCTAVVKGQRNDYNKIAPNWMTNSGFEYIQNSNLDMSEYEETINNLRAKSAYWASLPTTRGATTSVSSQAFNIECSDVDIVQVFNIAASSLEGQGYYSYVFNENCSDKTVLINVQGGGKVTFTTRHMKWTKNGKVQSGGWGNFPSCMNSAILWNFPDAIDVVINGTDEVQGSLLVNGNLDFQTSGQSGRTMVLGDLTQNAWGSEFHSFEFNPPTPLPDTNCEEVPVVEVPPVAAQTDAPEIEAQPTPTDAPIVPFTEPPTPSLELNGADDDDNDDTFILPSCPEDITLLTTSGITDFPVGNKPVVEIIRQDTSTVTVGLNQEWTSGQKSVDKIYYQYKENLFSNKCYAENDVVGRSLFDTITISCNVMTPYAHLTICVADNTSNGILSSTGDDATIPKCCHSEESVLPDTPTVCYSLEISCASSCTEANEESRMLRGSSKK